MGRVAAEQGDHQRAAELFRKSLSLEPNSRDAQVRLARALLQTAPATEVVELLEGRVTDTVENLARPPARAPATKEVKKTTKKKAKRITKKKPAKKVTKKKAAKKVVSKKKAAGKKKAVGKKNTGKKKRSTKRVAKKR